MAMLSKPSFGPRTSLIYITIGSLVLVWTAVYYAFFIAGDHKHHRTALFWIVGFMLTGITLIVVGLLLGNIGRAARRAEMTPEEVTNAEAKVQQTAAANPKQSPPPPNAAQPAMPEAPAQPAPVAPPPPAATPPNNPY